MCQKTYFYEHFITMANQKYWQIISEIDNQYYLLCTPQIKLYAIADKKELVSQFKKDYNLSYSKNILFDSSFSPKLVNLSVDDIARKLFKDTFPYHLIITIDSVESNGFLCDGDDIVLDDLYSSGTYF